MDQALARAVRDKKPVPEIDFTLHTMEDGTQVSTMERVVKGNARTIAVAEIYIAMRWLTFVGCQRFKRPL